MIIQIYLIYPFYIFYLIKLFICLEWRKAQTSLFWCDCKFTPCIMYYSMAFVVLNVKYRNIMAGKKKPKEEHGVQVNFRLKKRYIKELDHFTETCNFKSRTDLIHWCLHLGLRIFKGDQQETLHYLTRFSTQLAGEITDPRQKDWLEELQMEGSIKAQQSILELKHHLQDKAQQLTQ